MYSYCTGPFAGILMKRYSWRLLAIIGGLTIAFGLAISRFASSTVVLCLTFGVISGLLTIKKKKDEILLSHMTKSPIQTEI